MGRMARIWLITLFLFTQAVPAQAQGSSAVIRLLDRNGAEITRLTDGNRVQLNVRLSAPTTAGAQAAFSLDGISAPVATCSIAAGADTCSSAPFAALGWYWGDNAQAQSSRRIHVSLDQLAVPGELSIEIRPRPVVMVHGFLSTWETWKAYLGPQGYLASLGLQGFAVGDGQVPGVLNTGSPANPAGRTNSIAQNAEVLKGYIAAVQKLTGAEKVDLLAHSMGGMISRYYIDRLMDADNVAQVIFLGTPMSGSACVYPLAALGYLMPAALEILPDYMNKIFNPQISHRHGVPFYMVAGTLLVDPLESPCTGAPSDTVVSLDSATSIQLDGVQKLPMFHGSLTSDRQVFSPDVTRLLQSPPASFYPRADAQTSALAGGSEQFSRVYSGHIQAGESAQVSINIDPEVSLANFSLYDSSHSLDVEVRGASGNVITLDPVRNGVQKISDPASMLYLGYGFRQPKPGKWVITLKTTAQTPPAGSDYAIDARYIGGALLSASSSPTIPAQGEAVNISASLQAAGSGLKVGLAEALVRKPDGTQVSVPLSASGEAYSAAYLPDQAGLYAVEITLSGQDAAGFSIDRAAFLTFEVQAGSEAFRNPRNLVLLAGVALVLLAILLIWRARRRRRPVKN